MKRNNWIILFLLLSIGINLFLIGGIAYRVSSRSDDAGRPLPPNTGWIVRELSEARRLELEPLLEGFEEDVRSSRDALFTAQANINELMQSDEFDRQALDQAFLVLREINQRYQALSHEQTTQLLAELTEEERIQAMQFLDQLRPPRGRGGPRPPNGGPGGDPDRRLPPPPGRR